MGKILYAEDSEDDVFLLSHAFRKAEIAHLLVIVRDGQEAINYLCENGRPDLVLLDLKMPKLCGFDVMAFIRERPDLKYLPVIVLTASELLEDRDKAISLGARDYLVKSAEWKTIAIALKSRLENILAGPSRA